MGPTLPAHWRTLTNARTPRLETLTGTALASHRWFVIAKLIAIAVCVVWLAGMLAAAELLHGPVQWVVIATLAVTLPVVAASELLQSYSAYRSEWELANRRRRAGVIGTLRS